VRAPTLKEFCSGMSALLDYLESIGIHNQEELRERINKITKERDEALKEQHVELHGETLFQYKKRTKYLRGT
jgi:hypothetical protein